MAAPAWKRADAHNACVFSIR